ncbi:AbrB family transcriptional regulator [Streptomyces kaniharaensis]|uniref:AbrB family transcriptional regulator n=1 Tax=Streptomyces kaniharaensis TaxID=212423 RepID=A0A6N7L076_9ACTN|nr:AbrB family transcriptional regulator [Streptomyces kaniharaensis]
MLDVPAGSAPPVRRRRRSAWLAVALAACAAGEIAEPVLPAPHLLAPLLAGLAVAVAGFSAGKLPARVNRASQAILGVLMGSYLSPHTLHEASGQILPLTAVTAATVVLSLGAAHVLARIGGVDRASATLGMIAGGSAAVVSVAEEQGADPRLVAFMQYLRVALVAATAPVIVHWLLTPAATSSATTDPEVWNVVASPDQDLGLLLLVIIAFTGIHLGRLMRLPSPGLLGPMLLTAAVTMSGTATGFAPTGPLRTALFTVVGLDIGLRFTRPAVLRMRRLLPLALALTLGVSTACAALAWLLAATTRIPLSDAYLATTPGGINAVLATAVATHADVPLISSVQSLRLFVMVLLAPLLIRLATPRTRRRA